ncbi:MAG: class I tRNA ligase family protein, partial [Anaerolineales bacterium]
MYYPYNPSEIESNWQTAWEEAGLHRALRSEDKHKYYCLDYFPYPSGEGLHVGHCRNYIPSDVIARYKRMQGYNVL